MREAIAPIQNKVGQFLMNPPIRNILGQANPKIDSRFTMDTGRVFIANLAKGKLGAGKSNLLGSLLTTQFQLANSPTSIATRSSFVSWNVGPIAFRSGQKHSAHCQPRTTADIASSAIPEHVSPHRALKSHRTSWSNHGKRLGISGLHLFRTLRKGHGSVSWPENRPIVLP